MEPRRLTKAGIVALLAMASSPAHAYLDPGTGYLVLQAIVGAVAAGLVLLKMYWYRVLSWFRRTPPPADGDNTESKS